jgi:hypothetical protein
MSFGGIVAHFLFLGALAFPIRAPGVFTPVTHFIHGVGGIHKRPARS